MRHIWEQEALWLDGICLGIVVIARNQPWQFRSLVYFASKIEYNITIPYFSFEKVVYHKNVEFSTLQADVLRINLVKIALDEYAVSVEHFGFKASERCVAIAIGDVLRSLEMSPTSILWDLPVVSWIRYNWDERKPRIQDIVRW